MTGRDEVVVWDDAWHVVCLLNVLHGTTYDVCMRAEEVNPVFNIFEVQTHPVC